MWISAAKNAIICHKTSNAREGICKSAIWRGILSYLHEQIKHWLERPGRIITAAVAAVIFISVMIYRSMNPDIERDPAQFVVQSMMSQTALYTPPIAIDDFSKRPPINLNTATVHELRILQGIGEVAANSIVGYREENGGFESVEDLMNVKGIGKVTFDAIKGAVSAQ